MLTSVYFIFMQIKFFIKYVILKLPHPEKPPQPSPYDIWGRKKTGDVVIHEMSPLVVSRREGVIVELVNSERIYQQQMETFDETYMPTMEEVMTEEQKDLFFKEIRPLPEISIKMYKLLEEEQHNTARYAMIGKLFIDQYEDIAKFSGYVENYLSISIKYTEMFHKDKKFKKKMKGLHRRNDLKPIEMMALPVQRIVRYEDMLTDLLNFTPEWHNDHEMIIEALEKMKETSEKAKSALKESKRRTDMAGLEKKFRRCPPLQESTNELIGNWALAEDKMFIYVLSEVMLIVQQKTELLSRKIYFVVKREIPMSKVSDVVRDKKGIILKMTGSADIAIMLNLRGDEVMDSIKSVLVKRQ